MNNAVCASFLSQLEVYDEDIGLVAKTNTAQHKCLLFPIANFLSSTLILKISAGKGWVFQTSTYIALEQPSMDNLVEAKYYINNVSVSFEQPKPENAG